MSTGTIRSDAANQVLMAAASGEVIGEPVRACYQRHNGALITFITWICQGNQALAEDICQRTWLKVMACKSTVQQASFRNYLFTIARNTHMDILRSAYAQHDTFSIEDLNIPDEGLSPEMTSTLKENIQLVHKAINKLPMLQREVVYLRFFSEMPMDEIATLVGVGYETVKSRMRLAFGRMRRELERAELCSLH